MTKYFFIVYTILTCQSGQAQRANMRVQLSHYVLDSFRVGKVQLKTGTFSEQKLNYNILTGEMIFDNGGRYLAIKDPGAVDTVFIQDRKFVPVNNKFYEVLTGTGSPLLLEYTFKIEDPPVSVGYGNAAPATNTTSYTSLVRSGGVYDLNLPDDFKIIPGFAYWIRKDGKYEKFGNAKQLISIFPEKKEFINDFVKKNGTTFTKKGDLIALVQQLGQ